MSQWELRYIMTGKQVDAMIDAFLDLLPVKYYNMAHHFCCIQSVQSSLAYNEPLFWI